MCTSVRKKAEKITIYINLFSIYQWYLIYLFTYKNLVYMKNTFSLKHETLLACDREFSMFYTVSHDSGINTL